MPECDICVSERKNIVRCLFCRFECCSSCFQKHLLTIKLLQPFCMKCNHSHNLEFVMENTSIRFYNTTYRKHRVELLFEHEMSLLPESQEEARKIQRKRQLFKKTKLLRDDIKILRKELDELQEKKYERNMLDEEEIDKYQEILEIIWQKEAEKVSINMAIQAIDKIHSNMRYVRRPYRNIVQEEQKEPTYVSRCSANDCKGFTRRKKLTLECELCSAKYCIRCHLILDDEHKCDENNVLTVTELKESTKPCPKCMSFIFKNGGCNQMFCTSCKTAFDWTTGKIITENIHNPHYFDYLRSVQQQLPTVDEEYDRAYAQAVEDGTERDFFFERQQCVVVNPNSLIAYLGYQNGINENIFPLQERELLARDINFIRETNFRYDEDLRWMNNVEGTNRELRVKYLNSEITDVAFKKYLKYQDKRKEKINALSNLLTMYFNTAITIITKIYDSGVRKIPDSLVTTFLEEMKGLDDYTEAQLDKIQRRFGGFVPNIFHSRRRCGVIS